MHRAEAAAQYLLLLVQETRYRNAVDVAGQIHSAVRWADVPLPQKMRATTQHVTPHKSVQLQTNVASLLPFLTAQEMMLQLAAAVQMVISAALWEIPGHVEIISIIFVIFQPVMPRRFARSLKRRLPRP